MSGLPTTTVSAAARTFLADALESWDGSSELFVHLYLERPSQDEVFQEAVSALNGVAHNVDESYRGWRDLEQERGWTTNTLTALVKETLDLEPSTV